MKRRIVATTLSLLSLQALWTSAAHAEPSKTIVPAGGGLRALEVVVDGATVKERVCETSDCAPEKEKAAWTSHVLADVPTSLVGSAHVDEKTVAIDVVPIGEGRRIAHVRAPLVDAAGKPTGRAFELLLSAKNGTPKNGAGDAEAREPIFSGITGWAEGAAGARSGKTVLVYDRDASAKFVIVADIQENTRICGQEQTPLSPRGLDPKSLELRGATLHRLDKKAREDAVAVTAKVREDGAKPPLGRLLEATGGSVQGATNLTDGDLGTTWSEDRPGDGHGEFVTLRASKELPIDALVVNVAPKEASSKPGVTAAEGAAPKTFFVVTDQRSFKVTMPEDAWSKPGASYEISLPEPTKTSCVAIVLDEAFERKKAPPVVTLAEVSALTTFDREGASLTDVAKALGTERNEEAAQLLDRAGNDGISAIFPIFSALDTHGRWLAIDVATNAGVCDGPAMDLLTHGLVDKDGEIRKRAQGRVERCGKSGVASLARVVREGDDARRAAVAPLLAILSPGAAAAPISERLGQGSPATRRALRRAFSRAAATQPKEALLAFLQASDQKPEPRVDLLRALGGSLVSIEPDAMAALDPLTRASSDPNTRYVLVPALADLAASGQSPNAVARLNELVLRDATWPVRARAIETGAAIPALLPAFVGAASDPEPRVREAAFAALSKAGAKDGKSVAVRAIASDDFTFVRTSAMNALASMPVDRTTEDALEKTLEDRNPLLRIAAIGAIGKLRIARLAKDVSERLDDDGEYLEVRMAAARTLGAMCVQDARDRLTELALRARQPMTETEDRLGIAAIAALGALHPSDLEGRLAKLREKNVRTPVRFAVERALHEPTTCPSTGAKR